MDGAEPDQERGGCTDGGAGLSAEYGWLGNGGAANAATAANEVSHIHVIRIDLEAERTRENLFSSRWTCRDRKNVYGFVRNQECREMETRVGPVEEGVNGSVGGNHDLCQTSNYPLSLSSITNKK